MQARISPAALLTACVLCSALPAAEKEERFVSIFNGKDLTGWEGEEGFWSVRDGAITGISTPEKPVKGCTYLMWRGGKVADFELRFSFRVPSGNSGVQFRSRELGGWDVAGYQADFDAAKKWTGCLYDCNSHRANPDRIIGPRGRKVEIDAEGKRTATPVADPEALVEHVDPDDWNEYYVIARGPLITLKINGKVTSQVIDHERGKAHRSGILAVQLHGGPPMQVQVKDIRLKHLEQPDRAERRASEAPRQYAILARGESGIPQLISLQRADRVELFPGVDFRPQRPKHSEPRQPPLGSDRRTAFRVVVRLPTQRGLLAPREREVVLRPILRSDADRTQGKTASRRSGRADRS